MTTPSAPDPDRDRPAHRPDRPDVDEDDRPTHPIADPPTPDRPIEKPPRPKSKH
jgi:hypothetical protein